MKRIGAALLALAVAGCAATPYQEMGYGGGVRAQRVTSDIVTVTARGNAFTDADTVRNFVLRKSAEETLAAGFDWFVILSIEDRSTTGVLTTPPTSTTYYSGSCYGGSCTGTARTNYDPGVEFPYVKPGQAVIIRLGRGPKPEKGMNAHEVLSYIVPATEKK